MSTASLILVAAALGLIGGGALMLAYLSSPLAERRANPVVAEREAEDLAASEVFLAAASGDDWSPETRADMDQSLEIAAHAGEAIAKVHQLHTGHVVPIQRKAGAES